MSALPSDPMFVDVVWGAILLSIDCATDGCGSRFEADFESPMIEGVDMVGMMEARMASSGWLRLSGLWLCPSCAARRCAEHRDGK